MMKKLALTLLIAPIVSLHAMERVPTPPLFDAGACAVMGTETATKKQPDSEVFFQVIFDYILQGGNENLAEVMKCFQEGYRIRSITEKIAELENDLQMSLNNNHSFENFIAVYQSAHGITDQKTIEGLGQALRAFWPAEEPLKRLEEIRQKDAEYVKTGGVIPSKRKGSPAGQSPTSRDKGSGWTRQQKIWGGIGFLALLYISKKAYDAYYKDESDEE